jgi:hypothetical protein
MRRTLFALATCSLLLVTISATSGCSDPPPSASGDENAAQTAEALGLAIGDPHADLHHGSGSGGGSPPGTIEVTIIDTEYDPGSGAIKGPALVNGGVRTPAWFLDRPNTLHAAAPTHLYPPNPCDGLVHAWNNAVIRSNGGKNPTVNFQVFLSLGAAHQCAFVLTTFAPGADGSVAIAMHPTGGQTL